MGLWSDYADAALHNIFDEQGFPVTHTHGGGPSGNNTTPGGPSTTQTQPAQVQTQQTNQAGPSSAIPEGWEPVAGSTDLIRTWDETTQRFIYQRFQPPTYDAITGQLVDAGGWRPAGSLPTSIPEPATGTGPAPSLGAISGQDLVAAGGTILPGGNLATDALGNSYAYDARTGLFVPRGTISTGGEQNLLADTALSRYFSGNPNATAEQVSLAPNTVAANLNGGGGGPMFRTGAGGVPFVSQAQALQAGAKPGLQAGEPLQFGAPAAWTPQGMGPLPITLGGVVETGGYSPVLGSLGTVSPQFTGPVDVGTNAGFGFDPLQIIRSYGFEPTGDLAADTNFALELQNLSETGVQAGNQGYNLRALTRAFNPRIEARSAFRRRQALARQAVGGPGSLSAEESVLINPAGPYTNPGGTMYTGGSDREAQLREAAAEGNLAAINALQVMLNEGQYQADGGVNRVGLGSVGYEHRPWIDRIYRTHRPPFYRYTLPVRGHVQPEPLPIPAFFADGGQLTAGKAQMMLDEGQANGQALSGKQSKYFRAVAHGWKPDYMAAGGGFNTDEEILMVGARSGRVHGVAGEDPNLPFVNPPKPERITVEPEPSSQPRLGLPQQGPGTVGGPKPRLGALAFRRATSRAASGGATRAPAPRVVDSGGYEGRGGNSAVSAAVKNFLRSRPKQATLATRA